MQTYFDPDTQEPLQLSFQSNVIIRDDVLVEMKGVPLLKNHNNGKIFFPVMTDAIIDYFIGEAKKINNTHIKISPKNLEKERYNYAKNFNFKYSTIDYEYIPGLIREWNNGFLTPVFFNIAVLNKYSQHPKYTLEIFSETYGTISKGNEWNIQFGINSNKRVIIWLGDISSLPEEEIYYLRSENIKSDHDIHSEFYNAQINATFSNPSVQDSIFKIRSDLNQLVMEKYKFPLYILDGEISETLNNITRPVFWEEKHIAPVIESLNRIIVESINVKGIKSYLSNTKSKSILKNKKGLKIYQLWLEDFFDESEAYNIMSPFYILYDFRVRSSHLQSKETKNKYLQSIKERLNLSSDSDFETIYDSLLLSLKKNYSLIFYRLSK